MPYDESELVETSPNGRGFGAKSEERIAIINFLQAPPIYNDSKEVVEATGDKKAGTRLSVMYRDKLVVRKYTPEGVVVYALSEKGLARKAKQANEE